MNSQQMVELGTKLQRMGLSGRDVPVELIEALEQMEVEIDEVMSDVEAGFEKAIGPTMVFGIRSEDAARQYADWCERCYCRHTGCCDV